MDNFLYWYNVPKRITLEELSKLFDSEQSDEDEKVEVKSVR